MTARLASLAVFLVALAARLGVVAWAAARFPPTADGAFYHKVGERIAHGLGYTWLWPDGAVTYAAHYPVGYPALVGAAYAIAGPRPGAAMVVNALLGALAALAAHRLALRAAGGARPDGRARAVALGAGLLVALHPGLVAYTPALMTEGVTASLLVIAAWLAAHTREREGRARLLGVALVGLTLGLTTLVRPQSLVLAPLFGALAVAPPAQDRVPAAPRRALLDLLRPLRGHLIAAALATVAALAVCAPWTARNCVRMKHCALVSVNGGWNLLIGADAESTGAWAPIKVPPACREVWDEAQKDVCFGREARRYIREHPATWLGLVPRKLAATFDYAGAAPWYLHEANREAFPWDAKVALAKVETVFERVMLLFALVWAARPLRPLRSAVAGVGAALVFTTHGWIAHALLVAAAALRGRALLRGPVLPLATVLALAATMITHAVFFGAGRYSLVLFPLLTALAPLCAARAEGGEG